MVGVRAHDRTVARAFFETAREHRIRRCLKNLVFRHFHVVRAALGQLRQIFRKPRGNVRIRKLLRAVGDIAIYASHAAAQIAEQRDAIHMEASGHGNKRVVHAVDEHIGRFIFQKRILIAQKLLIIAANDTMVLRKLAAKQIDCGTLWRLGALRKLKIVGRERHGGQNSLQILRRAALPIERVRPRCRLNHRRNAQIARVGYESRFEASERRAPHNEVAPAGRAKRPMGAQKLDSLDDVAFARGIRAHENRESANVAQCEASIIAKTCQAHFPNAKIVCHGEHVLKIRERA